MPLRNAFRVLAAAIAILAGPYLGVVASAQTTSTITGRVGDASGAVLPGVLVTARNLETSLSRTAVTAADGRYVFALLPVGRYELRAELNGFKPMLREGIETSVAETVVVDLTLQVGGVAEEVRVSAGTSQVNTSTSELSYLVSGKTLEALPLNGRNYTDLALLQPGVLAYPNRDGGSVVAHGLGMSVNGQDPRANVYLLDGTLLNDFTNGPAGSAAGTSLGLESVREFRVETNAYSAEFGRNAGGQVNVLTKSGSNSTVGHGLLLPPQRRARRPQLLRHRGQAGVPAPPVRHDARRPDPAGQAVLLLRLRGAAREPGQDHLDVRARRQRAAGPAARPVAARAVHQRRCQRGRGAVPERVPARQRPFHRRRHRAVHLRLRPAAQRGLPRRAASTTTSRRRSSCSRVSPSTTAIRICRRTTRSSRARSARATSSSPASTAGCSRRRPSTRSGSGSAAPASARPSRPIPPRRSSPLWKAGLSATSTSAACSGSARRAPPM